jgi:hypothetical protein
VPPPYSVWSLVSLVLCLVGGGTLILSCTISLPGPWMSTPSFHRSLFGIREERASAVLTRVCLLYHGVQVRLLCCTHILLQYDLVSIHFHTLAYHRFVRQYLVFGNITACWYGPTQGCKTISKIVQADLLERGLGAPEGQPKESVNILMLKGMVKALLHPKFGDFKTAFLAARGVIFSDRFGEPRNTAGVTTAEIPITRVVGLLQSRNVNLSEPFMKETLVLSSKLFIVLFNSPRICCTSLGSPDGEKYPRWSRC